MSTIWMSTIPTKHEKLWSTNVIICQLQWVSSHWAHGSALQLLDPLEGLPKMKSPCHTFLCSRLPRCLTMFYFFEATTIISSSKMYGSSTRSSLGKWHQLPALSDPPRPRVQPPMHRCGHWAAWVQCSASGLQGVEHFKGLKERQKVDWCWLCRCLATSYFYIFLMISATQVLQKVNDQLQVLQSSSRHPMRGLYCESCWFCSERRWGRIELCAEPFSPPHLRLCS